MSNIDFKRFIGRLCAMSEEGALDPARFDWPDAIDPDAWYFTPELISLYGTPAWDALDVAARKRLSFCEAVNFFSMNVHGEKYLIGELSRQMYADDDQELSRYLLHFVAEETRHMMYFTGFCRRYAGRVYPDPTLPLATGRDPEIERFLLFARINVFEEIVDHYNRTMACDERLAPVVREINRIHHVEELRHLAFGRRFLAECIERHVNDWDEARRDELRAHLTAYLEFAWQQYYNPATYEHAGIADAFGAWRAVVRSPAALRHRATVSRKRLGFLAKLELLEAA